MADIYDSKNLILFAMGLLACIPNMCWYIIGIQSLNVTCNVSITLSYWLIIEGSLNFLLWLTIILMFNYSEQKSKYLLYGSMIVIFLIMVNVFYIFSGFIIIYETYSKPNCLPQNDGLRKAIVSSLVIGLPTSILPIYPLQKIRNNLED